MWLNSIKRRFSSTDVLDDERKDDGIRVNTEKQDLNLKRADPVEKTYQPISNNEIRKQIPLGGEPAKLDRSGFSLNTSGSAVGTAPNRPRKQPSPSAPSSPTKTLSLSAMMSVAKDLLSNTTTSQSTSQTSTQSLRSGGRRKILLIIDESNVDWGKYFRNRKIGDLDLRIEQAEFKDINLASYVDSGTIVDIVIDKDGSKVMRSFKPDFVLVRQHVKHLSDDWSNLIIGLNYGLIPSVNSFESIYNFRDKPWVFSELIKLANKHGHEAFPIINQTYYPNYKEMVRTSFPCVVKVGNAHQGLGKIQVRNALDFQDITSIVSSTNSYSTSEPFCESKCDIHIQKIGSHYKAYMKKSITGNWKANTGSSMLEQIPMNDRYKFWVDEVSKMFGGLDMCTVQAIVDSISGKDYIIDVCDCAFTLLGESLDTDRKLIADLVYDKMLACFLTPVNPIVPKVESAVPKMPSNSHNISDNVQPDKANPVTPHASISQENLDLKLSNTKQILQQQQQQQHQQQQQQQTELISSNSNMKESKSSSSNAEILESPPSSNSNLNSPASSSSLSQGHASSHSPQNLRQQSLQNPPNNYPSGSRPKASGNINPKKTPLSETKTSDGSKKAISSSFTALDEAEDTMNNLRKTFAGIFGNSNI